MFRSARRRLVGFFALHDEWERRGEVAPQDWVVGGSVFVFAVVLLELVRSVGGLEEVGAAWQLQWLTLAVGCLLLVGRRRWPLAVAILAAAHMFVTGLWMPVVMGQLSLQVVYFVAIFSGVAWARSRREMVVVVGGILVFMFGWIAWMWAVGSWLEEFWTDSAVGTGEQPGVLGPITAAVLMTALINLVYFGGAVLGGQVAWRAARQRARLAEQAETIADQAAQLQRRAVLEERLRIARELHDVVAHHVSVIGIQAAAGRRMLGGDHVAVENALAQVEESSREAVGQMRSLVGTIRDPSSDDPAVDGGPDSRAPEPDLGDVPALVAADGDGLTVTHDVVENPAGAAGCLPAPIGSSLYRIVQEALTNVRRHSTADAATVVVRVDRVATPPYAEVEVTDNGRPRAGTSGSGLGLLGVRERAAVRRGEVDIGPRSVGGFRVRVRFPLEAT